MAEKRARRVRRAVVLRTEQLAPQMVRVIFTGPDLAGLEDSEHTDRYVKILFAPANADYRWPFDPEAVRVERSPEQWPVTRTYTIRSYDPRTGEMAIDFVLHGADGLAGPWAVAAGPGDEIGFFGPGGGYRPDPQAQAHLLVGDEAAFPAIAAALERVPAGVGAYVYLEVAGPADHQDLPVSATTHLSWVHRGDRAYDATLAEVVRAAEFPAGDVQGFVHGNANLVRDLRRYLFVDRRLARSRVSISGYWRTGHTEDRWQASKRSFSEQLEAEERLALAAR